MPVRNAEAEWKGNFKQGQGRMKAASGAFDVSYSTATRFGEEPGTNPDELVAAAHAGCFSMAFSLLLGNEGFEPTSIHTTDKVTIEKVGDGFQITKANLHTEAEVPGIDEDTFHKLANMAKEGCPVSKALAGIPEITLDAVLLIPSTK